MSLAPILLVGCATDSSNPVVATLAAFLPGRADVSERAREVPYASIDFGIGGRGGLLILARESHGLTFWQTSRGETVVLRDGYLQSTSGIAPELTMTQVDSTGPASDEDPWSKAADTPLRYRVTRAWTDADGQGDAGRADARLECTPETVEKELPLTTRRLERCVETLSWARGARTRSVLWRDPNSHRIWAAELVAWPGSPVYAWRVARPWW